MQIRPFEELEAIARARYKARYASVPEPKVLNVEALVQFSAPRPFVWGGVGYRAPPLSFVAGVRLFVAANALRDLRVGQAPPEFLDGPARTAVRLLLQSVRPTRLRRLTRWGRPFFAAPAEEIEGLLRWLLHVPDDATFPPPAGQATLDFMAALTDFAREFPAWVTADRWRLRRQTIGIPVSWAAYVYGSRHLGRARAREDLRHALAVRAARSDEKGYREYNRDLSQMAGWTDGR